MRKTLFACLALSVLSCASSPHPKQPKAKDAAAKPAAAPAQAAAAKPQEVSILMNVPIVSAFPGQHQGFVGAPPVGWGQSARSVAILPRIEREIPGTTTRVPACWLGVWVDEMPVFFSRGDPITGAQQLPLVPVIEGNLVNSRSLLPPGVAGYLLLNAPGLHTWRIRCYDGPLVGTQVQIMENQKKVTKVVPALHLLSEMRDSGVNPRAIIASGYYFESTIGRLD